MRVSSNSFPSTLLQELQQLQSNQLKLQEQLASGKKLSNGSDNPVTYGETKELESRQRNLISFRRNLHRAQQVNDFTMQHAEYISDISKNALRTADLLNTTIAEKPNMESSANLVNNFLEQVLDTGNAKNGDEYIFSANLLTTQPFEENRDEDGNISATAQVIKRAPGDLDPVLREGGIYRIEDGTGVDFTEGGAPNNNPGTIFTYDGGDIDWGNGGPASLTALADVITEDSKNDLVIGQAYEVVGTGGSFMNAGASSNNDGTQFVYNGELPDDFNGAALAPLVIDDENRIESGALDANQLYFVAGMQYNGTTPTDLSPAGASDMVEERDTFISNGGTPEWGSGDGIDQAVLFGYKHKELAVQYVGGEKGSEFKVAEDTKLSPYTSGKDNEGIANLMNNLVLLRDAFVKAANANDEIDEMVAEQRIKDAANNLQLSDDDLVLLQSNISVTQMNMQVAETRDNDIFDNLEDRIAKNTDIDTAAVVTRLNQSNSAMQAALQSGARIMSQSLLDYI